jgi:hypothetical protein
MSGALHGWSHAPTHEGTSFVAPDRAARVRVRSRLAPLRRAREVLADLAAQELPGGVVRVDEAARLITAEGEHAALLSASVEAGARGEAVSLGVVYGDDAYTEIWGAGAPACAVRLRAAVAELTQWTSLGLGAGRVRRYRHDPPAGWQPAARDLIAEYYAPAFPARRAVIRVYPAQRLGLAPELLDAARLTDCGEAATAPVSEHLVIGGTSGRLRSGACGDLTVERAELTDARYAYVVTLASERAILAEAHSALIAVVGSIRPVPVARAIAGERVEAEAAALAHWST